VGAWNPDDSGGECAAGIRQKIFLIARLDERSRMNYLLQAAVKRLPVISIRRTASTRMSLPLKSK